MASFKLINNTKSMLPLSDGSYISPAALRITSQITLEMRRLEKSGLLTIVVISDTEDDDILLPDYIGTVDPNPINSGGSSTDLSGLLPATDGSIPEYSIINNVWIATTAPRRLSLDGGNF